MKKTVILITFCALLLLAASLISRWYYSPKILASTPNHIAKFFGLPSEVVSDFIVMDELLSQGQTCFSFGERVYWLKFNNPQSLREYMIESGAENIDSTLILIKELGNYHGELNLKSNNTAILVYKEINPE